MTTLDDYSLSGAPDRPATVWRGRDVALVLGIWFGAQLLMAVLTLMLPELDQELLIILSLAVTVTASVGGVAAIAALRGLSRHAIGLTPLAPAWVWRCVVLSLGLFVMRVALAAGLAAVAPALQAGADLLAQVVFPDGALARAGVFMLGALAVPVGEELLFRGVLYGALRRRWPFWPAALVSSLAFGLVHMIPLQIIAATLLGVALCWVYERTGSLHAPILVHVVNNIVAFGLAFAGLSLM